MFSKKQREQAPAGEPVIRASICNGEKVIGFRENGHFMNGEVVRSEEDIVKFCKKYGIDRSSVKTIY